MAVTEGVLRLVASDASLTRRDVLFEERTERLDQSADITKQVVVPYMPEATLKEDDRLIISLKGDTAGTWDSGSTIRVPVTILNTTTGIARQTMLSLADFKTMADAAIDTTDISYATSHTDCAMYTVKAQEQLRLGHKYAENSKIYIALVVS